MKLREAFLEQTIFGRSDVMKVIDIKASRASDLLKEMADNWSQVLGKNIVAYQASKRSGTLTRKPFLNY